jgi:alcohol dehydrogenase
MTNIPLTMQAVVFDGRLKFVEDHPVPKPRPGWTLIRVHQAGICKTDAEITKGYLGFRGVLGHEFTGTVVCCDGDPSWIGKFVVGEINAACGVCDWCREGLGRHCPDRLTLGIDRLDGCMAEYCTLPVANLIEIPDGLAEERAILTEPLSAACEILEQVPLQGHERVIVIGDGRLGILCAWVLATVASEVTLVGHHAKKLETATWRHLQRTDSIKHIKSKADIVVDATGSGRGIQDAMTLCRPRGTIVLKSTVADPCKVNLAPVVIDELTVIGSRCGRFRDGLSMMTAWPDMPLARLITARYPLEQFVAAFDRAARPDTLKVVLDFPVTER